MSIYGIKLSVIRMKFMEFEDTNTLHFSRLSLNMKQHNKNISKPKITTVHDINMVNGIWFVNLHCVHYYAHQHNLRYI